MKREIMRRSVRYTKELEISVRFLAARFRYSVPIRLVMRNVVSFMDLKRGRLSKRNVTLALIPTEGSIKDAAERLSITPEMLIDWLKQFGEGLDPGLTGFGRHPGQNRCYYGHAGWAYTWGLDILGRDVWHDVLDQDDGTRIKWWS